MAWWFWIVLGLALLGLELAMPGGFFLVFFGLSGLILGLVTLAVPHLSAWIAWAAFSVIAIVLLVAFRQKLIQLLAANPAQPVDSLVGEEIELSEDLPAGGQGSVTLRGTSWRAENVGTLTLTAGSRVKVREVDGLMLKIS